MINEIITVAAIAIIIVAVISAALYPIFSAAIWGRSIEYKKVPFYSTRLPAYLKGYTIAFVTDTHSMTGRDFEKVVHVLNEEKLDLLILGGDFDSHTEKVRHSMEILSKVTATDGIYGVEGNHDHYKDLFAAMEQNNIHPLSNSGAHIGENFYLAGVEDLRNRRPDIEAALQDARPNDFVLLVAHNPDVSMLQDTSSVDLILSGHTHGGQVTFFGIWAPALTLIKTNTRYGRRFMSGWAKSRDGVPVFVSHGTGYLRHMPRFFARPQVIILTLMSEETS